MLTMMLSQQIRIQSKTTSALLGICSATKRAAGINEEVWVDIQDISMSAVMQKIPTQTGVIPGQVSQSEVMQKAQMAGANHRCCWQTALCTRIRACLGHSCVLSRPACSWGIGVQSHTGAHRQAWNIALQRLPTMQAPP